MMIATRKFGVGILFAVLAGFLAFDLQACAPLNPFQAPPIFALGSGQASSGAHCAAGIGGN